MSCYHRSRKKTVLHCFCVRYSCSDLSLLLLAIFLLFQPGTSLVSTSSERPTVAGSTSTIRSVLANSTVTTTTISSHPNATDQSSSLNQSRTVSMSTNSSLSSISTTTSSSNTSSTPSPVSISSMATKKDVTSGTKIKVTTSQNATDSIVTTTKAVPILPPLKVSAGTNKRLQLPKNKIFITAYVMDEPLEGAEKQGSMTGPDSQTFILKDLVAGLYTLKLEVTGNNRAGEAYVNVTVIPPKRINKPPVAIIKPTSLQIKLPTSAILDGSDSTDDMKVVKYKWEEVSGPINDRPIESNASMLKLNHLEPGKYQFKLTVTDSDGATNSTLANVTAIKVPPLKVSAGTNKRLQLPKNEIILTAYVMDEPLEGAEKQGSMTGPDSQTFILKDLVAGLYTLKLEVTGNNRAGEAYVNVTVIPPKRINKPPVAIIKPTSLQIKLPTSAILDGSDSTDDMKVVKYKWEEVSGPINDRPIESNASMLKLNHLEPGKYQFKLTVTDSDGATNSTLANVTAIKVPPLKVSAGTNKRLQLPKNKIFITAYVMDEPLEGAEKQGSMTGPDSQTFILKDLVAGLYTLKLEVTGNNRAGEAYVNVTVIPPKRINKPPVAIIKPTSLQIKLPTSAILDGSDSTDDMKVVKYKWEEVSGPINDRPIESNASMLKLNHLEPGKYQFKLTVTDSDGATNSTLANVTAIKVPPLKVSAGTNKRLQLPKNKIFIAAYVMDEPLEGKEFHYKWSMITFPKGAEKQGSMTGPDSQTFILKDLVAGLYTLKLEVTGNNRAGEAYVNVTVIPQTDYRPTANAGSDVVINLPENSVTLYGNASTDDKGIVSYEWTKSSDDHLVADMMGVRSPVLKISNLEVGNYKFTLKVTDTGGQNATADVHVFVKPEVNQPPVAVTAGEITVVLPVASLVLDGQNSTDDKNIETYSWRQTSGPQLTLSNSDRNIATATGDIKVAVYMFKLTVYDIQKQSSSANLKITVTQKENKAPMADAGGDKVIQLPKLIVLLDGSRSHDDQKIVRYQWTRDPSSLAAGEIANNSNSEAVLQLINLIAGRYIFTLHVFDSDGLSSSDSASIIVKPGEDLGKKLGLFFCSLCNISVNSMQQLEAHKSGEDLGKKLGLFFCSLCNISVNSMQQLEAHKSGNKHGNKMQKLDGKCLDDKDGDSLECKDDD
ncbi:dyslexia-associated KIAA0319 isoform X2 [Octopus vulgaris]|nr:dyslexia-associated KIAA0319 isoform X2 [Octopus vulgaris]